MICMVLFEDGVYALVGYYALEYFDLVLVEARGHNLLYLEEGQGP